ncbi:MAG: hypothetical protein GXX96_37490 [Planctomycetaceae bacterium]|nr:hypothetical protein [Planctomycetaceae bacterium]
MRSPSIAVAWEIGARYRWWLWAGFAYYLVVETACRLLPQGAVYSALHLYLIGPLIMTAPLGLVLMFVCDPQTDLSSGDSLFPPRRFTLPLSTWALVGWPMLYGAAAMFLLWLALILPALRTLRPEITLLDPALLAAACLAWVQALAWTPFGLPYLRVAASVPLVVGVLILPVLAAWLGIPRIVILAGLAVQIPIAYAVAVAGVARARRGDNPQWSRIVHAATCLVRWYEAGERTFPTAKDAQRWLEQRRNGPGLTVALLLSTPFVVGLSFFTAVHPIPELPMLAWIASPLCMLWLPVASSVSAGAEFGLFRVSPRDSNPCAFLATRPMTCTDFVFAKLRTALHAVLVCYAVAVPVFLLTTLLTGWHRKLLDGLLYLSGGSAVGAIGIVLLALLLLPALTWKCSVENMFIGLCGRKWVTNIAIPGTAVAFWSLPALGWWLYKSPAVLHFLVNAAPYLLVLLVVAKLALAGHVYRVLRRRQLIEPPAAQRVAALWLAAVILLSGLALWLIPSSILPWHSAVFGAVLLVPIVRISLAPLSLAWNRHR